MLELLYAGQHKADHQFLSSHSNTQTAWGMQLREIAPDFYMTLEHHTSWTYVTWKFLTDPEVGPWTRMRRVDRGGGAEVVAVSKPAHQAGVLGKAGQGLSELTARSAGSRAAGLIS